MNKIFYQLGEDWRITTIPRNYVLQHRTTVKESPFIHNKWDQSNPQRRNRAGEDKWMDIGYWSRISALIDALPDELALAHGGDLKAVISSMDSLRKAISEAVA